MLNTWKKISEFPWGACDVPWVQLLCWDKVWREGVLGSGRSKAVPRCHHLKEFNPLGQDPAAKV